MKKADTNVYRDRLLELRARLRGDINQMADSALNKTGAHEGGMPIHMADVGSDANEQEFTLSLITNEEDTLSAIDAALEKVHAGTYGQCEECGGPITKGRLNALPYAAHCIKCATELQR